jgi:hypothetical protein
MATIDPKKTGIEYRVTSIYRRPLVPPGFAQIDPDEPLRMIQRRLLRQIRTELKQETFSDRAKAALSKAVSVRVKENSVEVVARHPAWFPLVEGQRREQMTWLVRAKAPIPIINEDGELIFRSATPKSMRDGKWIHPGRRPSHFVDRAKQIVRTKVRDMLAKEYAKRLRESLGGR